MSGTQHKREASDVGGPFYRCAAVERGLAGCLDGAALPMFAAHGAEGEGLFIVALDLTHAAEGIAIRRKHIASEHSK